jgi:hypothetical protein
MAIIFCENVPCNQIGIPSNKGKKPTIQLDKKRIAIRYDQLGIVVLKPHIDKISFGFPVTQDFVHHYAPGNTVEEFKQHIVASLFADAKTNTGGLCLVEGVPFHKKPWVNYNINVRYTPPGAKESFLIQASPKDASSNLDFLRFDVNPSKLNTKQIGHFREFITTLLLAPGSIVSYENFLSFCQVYRVDAAVDILGARPSDLEVLTLVEGKPKPAKKHVYKSKTGRAETLYPGATPTTSGKAYVYDKRKELTEADKKPMYGDFYHSRFECRISKTTFYKLANVNNRFSRVSIKALDIDTFAEQYHVHKLFIRYALETSLEKALDIIPENERPYFQKHYHEALHDIWDAKALWALWKDAVKASGFLP